MRSREGRRIVAVREDDVLAEFVGVAVMRTKVIGLCVSALVAGLGGLLLASFLTILAPSQFTLFSSVDMIVMVVVGGTGTLAGPLIGAVFLVYLPELLTATSQYRPAIIGVVLIVMTLFAPNGLVGLLKALLQRATRTAARPVLAAVQDDLHAG